MTPQALLAFLQQQRLAVQASVSANQNPQAAVVGIAVTDRFEVVFDTLDSTRKARNLRDNQAVALVIGGMTPGDERTAQYEGIADVPSGGELQRVMAAYYGMYPDGRRRAAWKGLIYVRVRPTWIRYSDYNIDPPLIVEFHADELVV